MNCQSPISTCLLWSGSRNPFSISSRFRGLMKTFCGICESYFFHPAMISLKFCVILFVLALLWVYHDCYSWILYFWSRTGCTRSPVQFSWFRNCLKIDSFLYTVQIKNNFVIFVIIYYSYIKANIKTTVQA